MTETPLSHYSNLSSRPPGPFVSVASRLLGGVRAVQGEIVPYAQAWQRANEDALDPLGPRAAEPLWVALGDSLTQGIGAPSFDRGWVGQVGQRLASEGRPHRIVNLAISGARVEDLIDRELPAMASLGVEPSVVTVLIGSNDLVRRRYRDALPDQIEQLLSWLPQGSVVANLPNPHRAAAAANDILLRAAADGRIVLANMRGPRTTSWRGKLAADHFHPNELGYAGIAAVFADAIDQRLRPSETVPG